jgi:hypothetical protein
MGNTLQWSEQVGVSQQTWEKLDGFLGRAIAEAKGDATQEFLVMIVLREQNELAGTQSERRLKGDERAKYIEEQSAQFKQTSTELVRVLTDLQARDVKTFWINRTVSATLTLRACEGIGQRDDVKEIILVRKQQIMA